MPKTLPRKSFFNINPYQGQVLLMMSLPVILIIIAVYGGMGFIIQGFVDSPVFNTKSDALNFLIKGRFYILFGFWFLVAGILIFYISWTNKLLGAFNRIIRELDEIIDGKRKNTIIVRKDDKMFKALIKRINVLVEHYIKSGAER